MSLNSEMGCSVLPSQLLDEVNLIFIYSDIITRAENDYEVQKLTQG